MLHSVSASKVIFPDLMPCQIDFSNLSSIVLFIDDPHLSFIDDDKPQRTKF
jgi:hypothetical protein